MTDAAIIQRLEDAIDRMIMAWNVLPKGRSNVKIIEEWTGWANETSRGQFTKSKAPRC
jgi:hypothetical protein